MWLSSSQNVKGWKKELRDRKLKGGIGQVMQKDLENIVDGMLRK